MSGLNSHKTILTLNVNGLNAPIKRHRLPNWIKSQNLSVCCIQEAHLICKDTHRLKTKGWRNIYQENREKKSEVAILVSDKRSKDQTNKDQKRQIRTVHNGKRISATRRANDPKYIHTQYRSTQIHKASS